MGNYTEIFFRSALRRDVPEDVVNALMYLVGDISEETALSAYPLPDHEFFRMSRWGMVGNGGSAYFPVTANQLHLDPSSGQWSIFILANLKNGGEIDAFFDWIDPYCDAVEGAFLGYELYEENLEPMIFVKTSPWKALDLEKAKFWEDNVKKEPPF